MSIRPRIAVLVFPGSNDDRDAAWALGALGADAQLVWHAEEALPRDTAAVVLPGVPVSGSRITARPAVIYLPASFS